MSLEDYDTEEITEKIACGASLRAVAREMGISATWLCKILDRDAPARLQYARAILARAHYHAEAIVDIADELNIGEMDSSEFTARQRLRVDARKWVASKFAPDRFGDKINAMISNASGESFKIEQIRQVIVQPKGSKD